MGRLPAAFPGYPRDLTGIARNFYKEDNNMQITDPVADMLTRIRNANSAKHETVDVPASNLKKAIAQILLMRATSRPTMWWITAIRA